MCSEQGQQPWPLAGACWNKGLSCLGVLEHFPLSSVVSRGHADYSSPAARLSCPEV